jgi:hypothetical protein
MLTRAYAERNVISKKKRVFERRYLPPTKPEDKRSDIVSQATLAINPALRFERIRLWEDIWVSTDGPNAMAVRSLAF